MWSETNRSHFMLIRIRPKGKRGFVIPIPLLVLDITLEAVADLAWLADLFLPLWRKKLENRIGIGSRNRNWANRVSLSTALTLCLGIIDELRKYGRWRMVEVVDGETCVYIDLY